VILGLGIAGVETERFRAADARFGERLRQRVFTPGERAYAAQRARGFESLAVRFAAKLATRRALGLSRARWHELEVVRTRGQAPGLVLHGEARAAARRQGVERATLSLTHDAALCLAHVVFERAT
jgi:holo-[acyl-carrier protein] synthase